VIGVGICFFLMRIILHFLVTVKFNDAFDRPAGAVTGVMRGVLIAVLIVFAAGLWPNETVQPLITVDSYFGRTIFRLAPAVREKLRPLQTRLEGPLRQPETAPAKTPEEKPQQP
jgi:uncharacterized membrane protein required for colicin V production